MTRKKLVADSDAPAFEFAKAFSLPTDPSCLRVISLDYHDIIYRVEGRKILSNESDINLIYVGRVTDSQQYDTLLTETLATALAADVAYALVGSAQLTQTLNGLYLSKLSEARFVDATEGTPGSITSVADAGSLESDTFIRARF